METPGKVGSAVPIEANSIYLQGVGDYYKSKEPFCDFVKNFFKNLWQQKLKLATGLFLIGVGLTTIFVDVVGLGFPAPFLAPVTHGTLSAGATMVVLAILAAFHETCQPSVTFRFRNQAEKQEFFREAQCADINTCVKGPRGLKHLATPSAKGVDLFNTPAKLISSTPCEQDEEMSDSSSEFLNDENYVNCDHNFGLKSYFTYAGTET